MIGHLLAHYRVLKPLGHGGMGEVYLAEDTRLKRQVALKILPEAVRRDRTWLARFRTEAEAAAQLNHPNIAQIYTIEETPDLLFIVMEYVDGQALTHRILSRGLALNQFFAWFIPLADGLCHAHERGITHKDLKPGNLMVSKEGIPKILDFGLAQITRPQPEDVSQSQISTVTMGEPGIIVGTPAYMSPEQAEGKSVDQRTDIFSLGVVLYEGLTGQRPFQGETQASIISSILKDEPTPVTVARPEAPYLVGRLIRKCLQKEVRKRYQSIVEVRNDLEEAQQEAETGTVVVAVGQSLGAAVVVPFWRRPAAIVAAVLLVLLGALLASFTMPLLTSAPEPHIRKLRIPLDGIPQTRDAAVISPDGTMIAYTHQNRLWIQNLNRFEPREIAGTTGAFLPFWSPNSEYVGYVQEGDPTLRLMKAPAAGGQSILLCDLPGGRTVLGATWSPHGMIVLGLNTGTTRNALYQVSDQSGVLTPYLLPDSTRGEWMFGYPSFLPDGRSLAFSMVKADSSVHLAVLTNDQKKVLKSERDLTRHGWYIPVLSSEGHLIYSSGIRSQKSLWMAPFSFSSMTLSGPERLISQPGWEPSVSRDGTLVYKSATPAYQYLVWVNRQGNVLEEFLQHHNAILRVGLSSDNRRIAVSAVNEGETTIWLHDARGTQKTRLVFERRAISYLTWSPHDAGVTFAYDNDQGRPLSVIARVGTGGQSRIETIVADTSRYLFAPDWSKDGRYLVYQTLGKDLSEDIWYVSSADPDHPKPFLDHPLLKERTPTFSPDGRFVAYVSDETGREEVFVTTFPRADRKWMVSTAGGVHPEWNARGDEIFYVKDSTLMAVKVRMGAVLPFSAPEPLFSGDDLKITLYTLEARYLKKYAVSNDGTRILVIRHVPEGKMNIMMVQNWAREFQERQSGQN